MAFLIIVDSFLSISPQTRNLPSRQNWKRNSTDQLDLFANRVFNYFKKLPRQIKKNCNSVESLLIRWDNYRKKKSKREFWKEFFWKTSHEFRNTFSFLNRWCINSLYFRWKDFLKSKLMWEDSNKRKMRRRRFSEIFGCNHGQTTRPSDSEQKREPAK